VWSGRYAVQRSHCFSPNPPPLQVDKLQRRATAAEVAAESGVELKFADRAMQSLVQDTRGSMQARVPGLGGGGQGLVLEDPRKKQ